MVSPPAKTVLLVDDDPGLRLLMQLELEAHGFSVIACASAEEAMTTAPASFDLAVVDYHLPGRSGLELLQQLRHRRSEVPALVITSERGVLRDPRWPGNRGTTLLTKPFPRAAFLDSVDGCLASYLRRHPQPGPATHLA